MRLSWQQLMFVFAKTVARMTTGGMWENGAYGDGLAAAGVEASKFKQVLLQFDVLCPVASRSHPPPGTHLRVGQSFVLWLWIIVKRIGRGGGWGGCLRHSR